MTDLRWFKMMDYGRRLGCHQLADRSFFYKKYQFPVCARCTGVIISSFFSLVCVFFIRIPICLCFALSFVMLVDWTIQAVGIKKSTNLRRLATGLIGGFGYSTLWYYLIIFLSHKFRDLLAFIFRIFY